MQMTLNLPRPALTVESHTELDRDNEFAATYHVAIMAGDTEIATFEYSEAFFAPDDVPWANDEDEAMKKALSTFGEQLKALLG